MVKVNLQDLWKLKLAWDDPVPDCITQAWIEWREDLPLITSHPIPRYHLDKGKEVWSLQLHGFCDASDTAFAIYVQSTHTRQSLHHCSWRRLRSLPCVDLPLRGWSSVELDCSVSFCIQCLTHCLFPLQTSTHGAIRL